MVGQDAAPAGEPHTLALGRPRDPAPRHNDRAQGALLEGRRPGNRTASEKRGPGDRNAAVERQEARGLFRRRPPRTARCGC